MPIRLQCCIIPNMTNIAFTGGGTGGHIYPGLAVAENLGERLAGPGLGVFWIGSNRGMDRAIVEGAGIEFHGVPAGKLRRHFSLRTIPDAFRVVAGFFAARRVLKKLNARLLFSKGGYVSVPPCAAAASLGIPVFAHESDFSPGLATRINMRFVRRTGGAVFAAYEDSARALSRRARGKATVSGNPVRRAFRSADPARGRAFLGTGANERVLLVLGGSQGAREVNDLVRACLGALRERYVVVHQRGPGGAPGDERDGRYVPLDYIDGEMPHVLAAAEIVVGRGGAGTVWECAALGKPMILIPLRGAGTRGDQVENARFFEREGAAVVLESPTPADLERAVAGLAEDPARRDRMAAAAARIGGLDGAAIIGASIVDALRRAGEARGASQ